MVDSVFENSDSYWLNLWRTNNIPFHKSLVEPELVKHIEKLKLKSGDRIFVPLCGKSKDMFWLAQRDYRVIGVELSNIACQNFFSEHNLVPEVILEKKFKIYQWQNIKLYCGNFFDLDYKNLTQIKAIYDCNALIALPFIVRKKYINYLKSFFSSKARMLLMTIEAESKNNTAPYSISKSEICSSFGVQFNICQLSHELCDVIPQHLLNRGYSRIEKYIYLISKV